MLRKLFRAAWDIFLDEIIARIIIIGVVLIGVVIVPKVLGWTTTEQTAILATLAAYLELIIVLYFEWRRHRMPEMRRAVRLLCIGYISCLFLGVTLIFAIQPYKSPPHDASAMQLQTNPDVLRGIEVLKEYYRRKAETQPTTNQSQPR